MNDDPDHRGDTVQYGRQNNLFLQERHLTTIKKLYYKPRERASEEILRLIADRAA
jgi:hypothetical protein